MQSGEGRTDHSLPLRATLPRPLLRLGLVPQGLCELLHTALAQLRVTLMMGSELNSQDTGSGSAGDDVIE